MVSTLSHNKRRSDWSTGERRRRWLTKVLGNRIGKEIVEHKHPVVTSIKTKDGVGQILNGWGKALARLKLVLTA